MNSETLSADMLHDLWKKFGILRGMEAKRRERILAGVIDGLCLAAQPYPQFSQGDLISPVRPAFDADYEAGYDVGETWARIAGQYCAPKK